MSIYGIAKDTHSPVDNNFESSSSNAGHKKTVLIRHTNWRKFIYPIVLLSTKLYRNTMKSSHCKSSVQIKNYAS